MVEEEWKGGKLWVVGADDVRMEAEVGTEVALADGDGEVIRRRNWLYLPERSRVHDTMGGDGEDKFHIQLWYCDGQARFIPMRL